MNITGSGSGTLDYQINNEPPIQNASCTVTGAEDDTIGSLVLAVSVDDPTHGWVAVGITLSDFSIATESYTNLEEVKILVEVESLAFQGGWLSSGASSVALYVRVSEGEDSCVYSGSFSAENLTWTGAGMENTLAIKWGTYSVTLEAEETP